MAKGNGVTKQTARQAFNLIGEMLEPEDGSKRDAIKVERPRSRNDVTVCILPNIYRFGGNGRRLRVGRAVTLRGRPDELPQMLERIIAADSSDVAFIT